MNSESFEKPSEAVPFTPNFDDNRFDIDFNPPAYRQSATIHIKSDSFLNKEMTTKYELILKLIKLDILALGTSIFKIKIKSKDQNSNGKLATGTKNKYKIEAPPGQQPDQSFAAEVEFQNETITKVISLRKHKATDYFDQIGSSAFQAYIIVIDIINSNKVVKSVELELNQYLSQG